MIVEPFRSRKSEAFHTNTLCTRGKAIPPNERLRGDGGLPQCETCQALVGVRSAFGRAEQAVRHDLLVLAEAEAQGGFGVLIWCPGSDEVLYSEGIYEIHGVAPVATIVPAEILMSAVHPDDLPSVQAGFAAVAGGGGGYEGRHRIVRPDGTIRWVQAKARLKAETPTHPEYVLGTVVDITDYLEHREDVSGASAG